MCVVWAVLDDRKPQPTHSLLTNCTDLIFLPSLGWYITYSG